jgi:hypothetical protein
MGNEVVETKNKSSVLRLLQLTKQAAETVSHGHSQQDRVWRDRRRWASVVADAASEALRKWANTGTELIQ